LYKQEFSAMNVIKSDLSITLLLKQCWMKYFNKMISAQLDCRRHQCRLALLQIIKLLLAKIWP
jgi:hypothetical protein